MYTECKYRGPLGRPGSSWAKARLVRPQEFYFDCASKRLSLSICFASSCCVPECHQKDFTLAGITELMRFGAAMESTLQRKCARFPCFRREDSRKYLNERIFARDGAAPRCLHGLLFIQQKVNILENGSIRCGL